MEYLYGVLNLDAGGYVIATLVMLQITMMAVTLYLHRDQAFILLFPGRHNNYIV